MKEHVNEMLERLPTGPAGKQMLAEWVGDFEQRKTVRPLLVLVGDPGLRGSLQAFARAVADEHGLNRDLYYDAPAVEESTALAGGGEITIVDGAHELMAHADVREDAKATFAKVGRQEAGGHWIVLIAGDHFLLPEGIRAEALQVSFDSAVEVS